MRGVHVQADGVLAVLVGRRNVHVDVREGRRDDGAGLHLDGDLDRACLEWERDGLHGDLTDGHGESVDNVGGRIAAAVGKLRAQGRFFLYSLKPCPSWTSAAAYSQKKPLRMSSQSRHRLAT